jgi:hypothetical protein
LTVWIMGTRRMILEASLLIASVGNKMTRITIAV